MPDLPTLTVTQAQADRIIASFNGQVDDAGQPLTPTQAYRRWLATRLREHVLQQEGSRLDRDWASQRRTQLAQIESELP